ncbi:MAG TPA: hypothetical protein VGP12_05495, partial [Nitrosospira sp.]|nr:hypothetical protein [Nitrosospira sp.]
NATHLRFYVAGATSGNLLQLRIRSIAEAEHAKVARAVVTLLRDFMVDVDLILPHGSNSDLPKHHLRNADATDRGSEKTARSAPYI